MAKRPQKRRRPRPEQPEKPSRRRLLSGLAALVGASGLLATVTGLVITRSVDPITDGAADLVGSSPLVVYPDEDDIDALTGAAFAFDRALPATAVKGPSNSDAVSDRLLRAGAVQIGQAGAGVTIENRRKETAVITSIKAKVRERASVPSAALVVVGGQGGPGEGPVELHFDLDSVDLDARKTDKGRLAGEYLDEQGLTVESGEKLRFNLIGHTTTARIDWVVQVRYLVGGETRTLDLQPEGRSLKVTGASLSYGEAYTWDSSGLTREPIKELCPVDCRRIVPGTPG
ncbi:hypothetical protein [Actinoplanes sp. M2I2]|uniref:hypothetical protein n=1 Tax=Actinoplanes sp. M2I2 TaxID=1734444 RepID=UPI002022555E|nr:hypothetical protein [Actinoplanes sp. M2I2]